MPNDPNVKALVERVAKALYTKGWSLNQRLEMPPWEMQEPLIQIQFCELAQVAIDEALR
jgi:hypothetical protein